MRAAEDLYDDRQRREKADTDIIDDKAEACDHGPSPAYHSGVTEILSRRGQFSCGP